MIDASNPALSLVVEVRCLLTLVFPIVDQNLQQEQNQPYEAIRDFVGGKKKSALATLTIPAQILLVLRTLP
jgi:hypothetical protein